MIEFAAAETEWLPALVFDSFTSPDNYWKQLMRQHKYPEYKQPVAGIWDRKFGAPPVLELLLKVCRIRQRPSETDRAAVSEDAVMATTLKIAAKNQVTLRSRVKPARDFAGCVENVAGVHLSVEEINEAIGDAAAEAG